MGLNMPRSADNRSTISNHSGEMVMRPASTLARSSRSSTISVSSRAEVRMNSTCFSCSDVSGPSRRDSRMPVMLVIEVSGVRNSWLMYERKRLLSSVASRSCGGLVVELRVQRDHALVGLIELLAQRDDFGFLRCELRLKIRWSSAHHHDSRVIAFTTVVAIERGGNDRRMPREQVGAILEIPARGQPVRMHDQERAGIAKIFELRTSRL